MSSFLISMMIFFLVDEFKVELEGAYTSRCLMPVGKNGREKEHFICPCTKFLVIPIDSCWGQVIQVVMGTLI